jgi:hypothetical protein
MIVLAIHHGGFASPRRYSFRVGKGGLGAAGDGVHLPRWLDSNGQREMELSSMTRCALEPDPAAMHLDDLPGDWQAKARTDTPIHTIDRICVRPTISNKHSVIEIDRHSWALVFHGYLYGFGV